jgi:uncharacterized protein YihD (DUF1040 family)
MKRSDVLKQIDHIQDTICKPCPVNTSQGVEKCKGCEHFKQLNELGKMLTGISQERRGIKLTKVYSNITKEAYLAEKDNDLTDRAIIELYNLNSNKLQKLKTEWGLTKAYNKPLKNDSTKTPNKTDPYSISIAAHNKILVERDELLKSVGILKNEINQMTDDRIALEERLRKEIKELHKENKTLHYEIHDLMLNQTTLSFPTTEVDQDQYQKLLAQHDALKNALKVFLI